MPLSAQEFETLYDAWAPAIYNFTARLVGRQEARDVVQEVFLRLFRARVARDKVKPWLYRVAYNLCMDHHRKNKRTAPVPEIRDAAGPESDPEAVCLARESMTRLLAAFRDLPPDARALLLLRERHDASYQEIAAITGHTVEAVRSQLYRTRAALHRALEKGEAR